MPELLMAVLVDSNTLTTPSPITEDRIDPAFVTLMPLESLICTSDRSDELAVVDGLVIDAPAMLSKTTTLPPELSPPLMLSIKIYELPVLPVASIAPSFSILPKGDTDLFSIDQMKSFSSSVPVVATPTVLPRTIEQSESSASVPSTVPDGHANTCGL